jgi:hypothetical protein
MGQAPPPPTPDSGQGRRRKVAGIHIRFRGANHRYRATGMGASSPVSSEVRKQQRSDRVKADQPALELADAGTGEGTKVWPRKFS